MDKSHSTEEKAYPTPKKCFNQHSASINNKRLVEYL